ncbi:excinuclease ABC subunit UvrC [Saprospira grandis]|uniref:UvrABC system protein C n=1 Tax=Saprospira grandis (strain Lewin) TaxID=984262 RepID=H6L6D1_SAPGL|nr:excinuclease ABC subunit UvrC [Saprospira grandis]AFC24073.1 uvrabc system protein c [Saprospira grandis str. Lewin]
MNKEDYKKLLPSLPTDPGVYRFIGADEEILYIGKAKNLKKRIASYFTSRKDMRRKTKRMVMAAKKLNYTLVETEQDALLLEATLIKKHQPRYNVALKHSRPYPYICIKKERFPRIMISRKVLQDGSKYYGPYVSKKRMYTLLELIKELFQLRSCALNLSEESIAAGKHKVCLEYHIKNCKAPCVGFESEANYMDKIEQVQNMLKGQLGAVRKYLKSEMGRYAEELNFEQAQRTKVQLALLENYQGKSTVVNANIRDLDVFTLAQDEKGEMAYINYLKVVEGAIINTFMLELKQNLDTEAEDLLLFGIRELREKFQSIAPEIVVPFEIQLPWSEIQLTVPKIGDKKKLLELSEKNAKYFILQKQKQALAKANKMGKAEQLLEIMKKDLQIDDLPIHIECFDNSNLQGNQPVSAMVVFKNGRPAKKEYRHYHVKTVVGPDDFASMEEVVFRRYKRLLEEKKPLPQLIVIDGGKGQLSAAVKSLKALGIFERLAIIGIAKRLEEIFFPNDPVPLLLSKKSPTLKVIQQARDEAHRFAISFHRDVRSKQFLQNELRQIPGVGEKTQEKLLLALGSVKEVKKANLSQLEAIVGANLAKKIRTYFDAKS